MHYLLIFLISLLTVVFSIPPIIKVSFMKRLFDKPLELRKIHKRIVPNFGGIAIFTAFLFASSLLIPASRLPEGNVLLAAALIMFMTGLKDDIVGLSPSIKLVAQFTTAIIVTMVANMRINNLLGILDITELHEVSSVLLTIVFIIGVVNAFNLIDGIDGLAGSLGLLMSIIYAYIFFKSGDTGFSWLAMALAGALTGFLFFNITPAKIFMGDSGSLLLGFMASVFTVRFLQSGNTGVVIGSFFVQNHISLALAILIIPIFDTLRVFTLRILKNTSPFMADSNHLHHRLLQLGLSHIQTTFILSFVTVLFIMLALTLQELGAGQVLAIMVVAILLTNGLLSLYIEAYKRSLLNLSAAAEQLNKPGKSRIGKGAVHRDVLHRIFKK